MGCLVKLILFYHNSEVAEGIFQWGLINENDFLSELNIYSNRYMLLQVAGHSLFKVSAGTYYVLWNYSKNPLQETPEAVARKVTIMKAIRITLMWWGIFVCVFLLVFLLYGVSCCFCGGFCYLGWFLWFGLVLQNFREKPH